MRTLAGPAKSENAAVKKSAYLFGIALSCCWTAGCATQKRVDLRTHTGGSAFLYGQFQAFDGNTGRPLRFTDIVERCQEADVVLLGEQHGDAICNQLEAQLLHALLDGGRPVMLAMEFFEADTQATLDAYLTGRIDEPDFLEQTKRPPSYLDTHRPLIELSRAARAPVTAANAPRRLVSDYRKSGLTYEAYRAGLDAEQRRWLPVSSKDLEGPYRDRFAEMMTVHGGVEQPESQPASQPVSQPTFEPASEPASQAMTQPAPEPVTRPAPDMPASMPASMPTASSWEDFFKAQVLWDDAMAESIANFRDRFPRHRALLIVGSFHVAHEGGTVLKLRERRPHDRLVTVVYRDNPDGQFAFREEDHGAGDVVIYGLKPPKPEKKAMPMPSEKPETQPAESQPASMPATATSPAPATMPAPEPSAP